MLKYKERPSISNLQMSVIANINVYQRSLANTELYAFLNYTTHLEAEIRELNEEIVELRERIRLLEYKREEE